MTAHADDGPFGPPAAGLHGVVRYRGELAQRGLRLNEFLVHIAQVEHRAAFLADEEGEMERWQLAEHERDLVRRRDYAGLLAHGANVYAIAKSGYVFGATLVDIGAAMAGTTTPQLLARFPAAKA